MFKHTLILAILAALTLTIRDASANTSEDLKQARKEKKELCLSVPSCKASLDAKAEERNRKALEKVLADIAALKSLKN